MATGVRHCFGEDAQVDFQSHEDQVRTEALRLGGLGVNYGKNCFLRGLG